MRAKGIVEDERDAARRERDAARRELEECRAAMDQSTEVQDPPAVTQSEIKETVADAHLANSTHGFRHPVSAESETARRLWRLMSGVDEAVYVIRDSQLPTVFRREGRFHLVGMAIYPWYDEEGFITDEDAEAEYLRQQAGDLLHQAARLEAVARAVEAEDGGDTAEEADPLEGKAVAAFEEAWREAGPGVALNERIARGVRAARTALRGSSQE